MYTWIIFRDVIAHSLLYITISCFEVIAYTTMN